MPVEWLTYTIRSLEGGRAIDAAPGGSGFDLGPFRCSAAGTELKAEPLVTFDAVQDARDELEPLLANWAIELDRGVFPVEFRYASGHVTVSDANGGTKVVPAAVSATVEVASSLSIRVTVPLDGPKESYRHGPVVDYARARWLRNSARQRELPPARAYALLTWLESMGGDRRGAAVTFNIHHMVLDRAGRLTAQNDPEMGRKLKGPAEPLDPVEVSWLDEFVREAAWRVIEVESGMQPTPLSMGDLPTLP